MRHKLPQPSPGHRRKAYPRFDARAGVIVRAWTSHPSYICSVATFVACDKWTTNSRDQRNRRQIKQLVQELLRPEQRLRTRIVRTGAATRDQPVARPDQVIDEKQF